MSGRLLVAWFLLAAGCSSWESSVAAPLKCPDAPAQTARSVSVETRGKLAALGKLGAGELQNKVQVTVQPLLDKVPNADKVLLAQMLTSVFCQLLSDAAIDSREKLDRFQTFGRSVMDMASSTPAVRSTGTTSLPAIASATPRQSLPPAKAAAPNPQLKAIGLGATAKEVGEYLAGRPVEWTREKPRTVAFSRSLDGLTLKEEIIFDDNDRAIGHSLSTKAERTSGRSPKTVGPEPSEFCEFASQKLVRTLSGKLGAPTQPLQTESKSVPVNWSQLGYDEAPCDPMSYGKCEASARRTSSRAAFELNGSPVLLTAVLFDVQHRRAKTIASNVYEKSSTSCTVKIEDQSFAYLNVLTEPAK